jgi:hypothetical protein
VESSSYRLSIRRIEELILRATPSFIIFSVTRNFTTS